MTNGDNTNARAHVNQVVAISVFQDGAVRLFDEGGQHSANSRGYDLGAPLLQGYGIRTWNGGDDVALLLESHVRSLDSQCCFLAQDP
jgi:hypothetical protein